MKDIFGSAVSKLDEGDIIIPNRSTAIREKVTYQ
jgi:hypothetical protein